MNIDKCRRVLALVVLVAVTRGMAAPACLPVPATELWRLAPDDTLLLGAVIRAVPGPGGTVDLLDAQLAHILRVGPDGAVVDTLGREGDGPGEFRHPRDLLRLPDGRLGVVQVMPPRLVTLTPDGRPAPSLDLSLPDSAEATLDEARVTGRHLVVALTTGGFDGESLTEQTVIGDVGPDGTVSVRWRGPVVARKVASRTWREHDGVLFGRWTVTADGLLAIAPMRDDGTILLLDRAGRTVRRIDTGLAAPSRSAARLAELRRRLDRRFRSLPYEMAVELLSTEPAIRRLLAFPDGQLWVEPSAPPPVDGAMTWYLRYDAAGAPLPPIAVTCEGVRGRDELFFLAPDRCVLVKGYRDTPFCRTVDPMPPGGEGVAVQTEVVGYRLALP